MSSNKTKKISVLVDQETYDAIKEVTQRNRLPMSAYLTRAIKSSLKEEEGIDTYNKEDPEEDGDSKKRKASVIFDEDASAILKQKATEQGLSERAYLRNLIVTKDFKVYRIQTDDIEDIISEVHSAISSLSSTVGIIKKQGKGEIFKQDVERIEKDSEEIKTVLNKIVRNLYSTRRSTKNKLVRKLERE